MNRFKSWRSWVAREVIDLGIPKDAVRPEDLRRIRIISITTLGLCGLVAGPAALQFAALGVPVMAALIVGSIAGGLANLLLLRARRNAILAAHVGVGLLACLLVVSNVVIGGFYDPGFSLLYVVPLTAAAAVDMRGAAFWTGFVICTTVGFWLLPEFAIVLVSQVPEGVREGNALFNRIMAVLAISVIGAGFVTGQRRAERQLATANQDLLTETAYVQLLMHGAVAANEARSFENAMSDSMHRICETMDWVAGNIFAVNEDGSIVSTGILHLRTPELERLGRVASELTFRVGEGIVGLAVSEGAPQIRESIVVDENPESPSAVARSSGIRSAMAVPVFVGAEVPSVMLFATTRKLHQTQRLIEVFKLVGVQLGKVAERTALQERVQHSQKMEAVGQLAAGVAHEINNPMSYVRSNLHSLREGWGEIRSKLSREQENAAGDTFEECQELIEESLEGVERTIAIVRDVKEFSHNGIDDRARWQTVELSDLMASALRVVVAKARSGVRIELLAEPSACRCSPNQVRQVFINLIVNAIQAVGDSGNVVLETGSSRGEVFARVTDDGPGMSEATRKRLFDPFFTTKAVGEGTGLGLSVSYEIVRKHGGQMEVSSELGHGASFEVRLPVES